MGATLLQHSPVSIRKHCDIQWWTVELSGTGECRPEALLVLKEDMPPEGTSSTGLIEPQKDCQLLPSGP